MSDEYLSNETIEKLALLAVEKCSLNEDIEKVVKKVRADYLKSLKYLKEQEKSVYDERGLLSV